MSATPHLAADDRGILIGCPQCHRANRIPFDRLHQIGQWGSGKAGDHFLRPAKLHC